jgi:uncharacterized membrane protein
MTTRLEHSVRNVRSSNNRPLKLRWSQQRNFSRKKRRQNSLQSDNAKNWPPLTFVLHNAFRGAYRQNVPRSERVGRSIEMAHVSCTIRSLSDTYVQSAPALRHPAGCEKLLKSSAKCSDMTNLAEIQEAIEKLAPEERAALREWLDESDPDAMAVIRERVRQIRAGEATLIDGDQVEQEMRQLARQIANQ